MEVGQVVRTVPAGLVTGLNAPGSKHLWSAVISYVGEVHFRPGRWVGLRLYRDNTASDNTANTASDNTDNDEADVEPPGKNDGSVEGKRYFECAPGFGLFVPASRLSDLLAKKSPSSIRSVTGTSAGFGRSPTRPSPSKRSSTTGLKPPSITSRTKSQSSSIPMAMRRSSSQAKPSATVASDATSRRQSKIPTSGSTLSQHLLKH